MYRYKQPEFLIPALVILAIVLGVIFGVVMYSIVQGGVVVKAAQFDHSNCQYPNRLSNPPDGCDNTDPARPECMKGGTEDCSIPEPKEDVQSQPIITVKECK